MKKQKIINIKLSKLKLWSENPRDPLNLETNDFEIITRAINNEIKWNLPKLIREFGDHFDYSDIPIVIMKEGKYIVYDGNRRVALLKYLKDESKFNSKGFKLKHRFPQELIDTKEIPCNVCTIDIALKNIQRKHSNSGTWKELDREYFKYLHLNEEKSLFLKIEEETGLISRNPNLNQRFIREEVFTEKNLKQIGIGLNENNEIVSDYDDEFLKELFVNIDEAISSKDIYTRGPNRGKLLEPLVEKEPELETKIKSFDDSKSKTATPLKRVYNKDNHTKVDESDLTLKNKSGSEKENGKRNRTPINPDEDILFGGKLILKSGKVNDLYRAIEAIYISSKKSEVVLPIIGMSLRLILEVTARLYFEEKESEIKNKDQILSEFVKVARTEMSLQQTQVNYFSLTNDWLNKNVSLDGMLGKYAHGNIIVEKSNILAISKIVGQILVFYQGKQ